MLSSIPILSLCLAAAVNAAPLASGTDSNLRPRIVVDDPPGPRYSLQVKTDVENPINAVTYVAKAAKHGDDWLLEVLLPSKAEGTVFYHDKIEGDKFGLTFKLDTFTKAGFQVPHTSQGVRGLFPATTNPKAVADVDFTSHGIAYRADITTYLDYSRDGKFASWYMCNQATSKTESVEILAASFDLKNPSPKTCTKVTLQQVDYINNDIAATSLTSKHPRDEARE